MEPQNTDSNEIRPVTKRANPPLDLAEWSYFWLGVERADLARGTVANGKQMYVEYWVPSQIRHPYPIVMVHGGGGQGTDWTGTPDGRRGWALHFVEEGFKVYVVDRPGHGRSPFHPDLHGPFPRGAATYEQTSRQFTAPEKAEKPYGDQARLHTQWPGTGLVGDPYMDQVVPGQGGSFVADLEITHNVWRQRLAELFDKIGPAMIMTHSMGGPNAWIAGDVRPNLVKAMIGIEPAGPAMGNLKWGVTACKMTYDPPASNAAELKVTKIEPNAPGLDSYFIQEEPARQLVNLKNIPAVIVTSPASYHAPYDPGTVAFLRQAGVNVEHIKIADLGIQGNAHFMMMEKNNREVLQPVLDWIAKNVEKGASAPAVHAGETAMKLEDMGFFWVGVEKKKTPYGTIARGAMYVQYLTPSEVRHRYPIVLVHGGAGQMLHYMGSGDGAAGWAHYYVQAGYRVFLVDRPGHGRVPYHPDSLGPIGPQPTYQMIIPDTQRSAVEPNKRWPGTGVIGDPMLDQLVAGLNAMPQDDVMAHTLWASRGAELLDKIGPAIVQVHSAGGPFGWIVANQRPQLVKAIVDFEGGFPPFEGASAWGLTDVPMVYDPPVSSAAELQTHEVMAGRMKYKLQNDPARRLKNLQGIPILCLTAERSSYNQTPAAEFLKQAGCDAEDLKIKDKGILGNGHFMMMETNRKEAFEVIRGWIESKLSA